MARSTLRWLSLALLGILVAAAVSIAASRLASQQIGLASQPVSAGDALAPRMSQKPKRQPGRQQSRPSPSSPPASAKPPLTTPPTTTAPPAPPTESSPPGGQDGEYGGSGADD